MPATSIASTSWAAVTPLPQYAATSASRGRPDVGVERAQLLGGAEAAVGVEVGVGRHVDRAGHVAGHRVDRLDLAAVALRCPRVDQHPDGRHLGGGDHAAGRRAAARSRPASERCRHRSPPRRRRPARPTSRRRAPARPRGRGAAAATRPGPRRGPAQSSYTTTGRAPPTPAAPHRRARTARGRAAGADPRSPGGSARASSRSTYTAPGTWPASCSAGPPPVPPRR